MSFNFIKIFALQHCCTPSAKHFLVFNFAESRTSCYSSQPITLVAGAWSSNTRGICSETRKLRNLVASIISHIYAMIRFIGRHFCARYIKAVIKIYKICINSKIHWKLSYMVDYQIDYRIEN